MGRQSQRKGRRGELELARKFQENGIPAKVGSPMNYGTEPDILGVFGVHVECKRTEELKLSRWVKQSQDDAKKFKDGTPAIFWRKNGGQWMTFMTMDDWLRIYRAACKGVGHPIQPPNSGETRC